MDRTIIGRLATDAEADHVGAARHHARTTLRILENTGYRSGAGEWVEDPEPTRHIVRAWRELADVTSTLRTGDAVIVVGREKTEAWTDRETGEKRTRRVIEARHVGPDLRHMDVEARRRQRPDLAAKALKSWATHGMNAPTVTTVIPIGHYQLLSRALDGLAAELAHLTADDEGAGELERAQWERDVTATRDLQELIATAQTITLEHTRSKRDDSK